METTISLCKSDDLFRKPFKFSLSDISRFFLVTDSDSKKEDKIPLTGSALPSQTRPSPNTQSPPSPNRVQTFAATTDSSQVVEFPYSIFYHDTFRGFVWTTLWMFNLLGCHGTEGTACTKFSSKNKRNV
jgi:hypothetical protein